MILAAAAPIQASPPMEEEKGGSQIANPPKHEKEMVLENMYHPLMAGNWGRALLRCSAYATGWRRPVRQQAG